MTTNWIKERKMSRITTACAVAASLHLGLLAPAWAQSDPGTFNTVLNVGAGQPDGTSVAGGLQSINDTQINLFTGGTIGNAFAVPSTRRTTRSTSSTAWLAMASH